MDVSYLLDLLAQLKESIMERHSEEESLVVASETVHDLDHPINHTGPHRCFDIMAVQNVDEVLLASQLVVFEDVFDVVIELVPEEFVLSLGVIS